MATPILPGVAHSVVDEVLANDGYTWGPAGRQVPGFGFMVSIPGHEVTVPREVFNAVDVAEYIGQTYAKVTDHDALFWGAWVNEDDDRVYFDLSMHIRDRDEAMAIGRASGQIAIWDVENAEEIRL